MKRSGELKKSDLRLQAEAHFDEALSVPVNASAGRSTDELLHELQVHQIELELQNEALRQTQIALEESRDRYADLYEFAPVCYLTLTADGLIENVNLSGTALLGVTHRKPSRHRFSHLVSIEDRDRWHKHFVRALNQKDRLECELVLQRGDGTRFNVRADCLRVLCVGQAPTVRVVLTDITALKTAEFELRQAQQIARIGSWHWDAKTDVINASDEVGRIFGREDMPPFAQQRGIMYPVEAWRELNATMQQTLRTGVGYDLELPGLRGDGTPIWINVRARSMHNAAGKAVGLHGTVQDITERKQSEMALRQTKQLLELTMQMSHIGGWDLDLVDLTSRRTPEYDRIFGYEAALSTWNYDIFLDHVLAEDRAEVDRLFRAALVAQTDWNFTCRIRRNDGEARWIAAAGSHQRDDKGVVRRMTGIVQDITEARRLDQALHEQNEELVRARTVAEKANLAKTEFLSSMSHELRTPLNAILGFAQVMELSNPPPTPLQLTDIRQIMKAGWYLLELVDEILDLAQIESGKAALEMEAVPLANILIECRGMIEPQAQKKHIDLSFPSFDVPYFVLTDRTRLKQVLVNLLSNAIKYNSAGGAVTVNCTLTSPDLLRISVRDSGAGLDPQQLAQLFMPFNRLGQEGGAEEGTGIGLVVTKRLVEMMGGTMGVTSVVGLGSEFWFELAVTTSPPIASPDDGQAVSASWRVSNGRP